MLIQLNKWSILPQADASQDNFAQNDAAEDISRADILEALNLSETDEERNIRKVASWQKLTRRIREGNEGR